MFAVGVSAGSQRTHVRVRWRGERNLLCCMFAPLWYTMLLPLLMSTLEWGLTALGCLLRTEMVLT